MFDRLLENKADHADITSIHMALITNNLNRRMSMTGTALPISTPDCQSICNEIETLINLNGSDDLLHPTDDASLSGIEPDDKQEPPMGFNDSLKNLESVEGQIYMFASLLQSRFKGSDDAADVALGNLIFETNLRFANELMQIRGHLRNIFSSN